MASSSTAHPALLDDKFERFAAGLRILAWLWILGVTVAYVAQLDLASVLMLELSSVVAFELFGAAALAVGPASIGLALSYVVDRISYLTADLNLF
ncbi:MAG TPA: hypothetical protein VNQ14_03520 [Woeseiaceae bacterium]|nr:hypothetical protein [Woeseiaceae bacterium]